MTRTGNTPHPADVESGIRRHLLAIAGIASLPVAACDGERARPAETLPATSTTALNAELARLVEARDRWDEADITSYRMTLFFGTRIGRIECEYQVDRSDSTLTAGPLRHEGDSAVAAEDEGALALCQQFAVLDDVYEHIKTQAHSDDVDERVSVAYEFRGVPRLIQYPGNPALDGGGSLTISVSPTG